MKNEELERTEPVEDESGDVGAMLDDIIGGLE
jgi:hypothetical protein